MAIYYSGTTIGSFTLVQQRKDEDKPRKYKIQIRKANCLMCAIHVHKIENPENPKMCWRHDLVMFFNDEQHLKNCIKNVGKNPKGLFITWIVNWLIKPFTMCGIAKSILNKRR
jgi:hypothetical protein